MAGKTTFTMIKPSAFASNYTGGILKMINDAGFVIKALKATCLTKEQAGAFYAVHQGKPFYDSLVKFMSSGPIVAAILEKDNAVEDFRTLIGATNPQMLPKEQSENYMLLVWKKTLYMVPTAMKMQILKLIFSFRKSKEYK